VPQVDLAIPAFGYKNLSLSEIPSVLPATNRMMNWLPAHLVRWVLLGLFQNFARVRDSALRHQLNVLAGCSTEGGRGGPL